MGPVIVRQGDSPVILSQPHSGTFVPPEIFARLNARGQALADTDWHIPALYDGLTDGLTTVRATTHRYVIDVNRDPSGASLYPGQNTTGLCPSIDFDGQPIWHPGAAPSASEIADRIVQYHRPYHTALTAEIVRLRAKHGFAILYDCHSIRSDIPFLFDGTLPVFSIGTNERASCAPVVQTCAQDICQAAVGFETVVNARFKGGWITRHYGQPGQHVHAIQMELAQRSYMAEQPPWTYDQPRAEFIRPPLRDLLNKLKSLDLSPTPKAHQ